VAEATGGVLYADTSALVKLVVREVESDAIEAEVARWDLIATGDIAVIELPRATARARADGRAGVANGRVVSSSSRQTQRSLSLENQDSMKAWDSGSR
jgi:predicted nucleic acid-binding protein